MTSKTSRIKALSGTGLIVLSTALACALSAASDSPPAEDVKNTIINPQSYPTVGGSWTVTFNTTGKADLTITTVNGTEFNKDLMFLEVRCGDEIMNYELINNSILIRDYECSETGAETLKVQSGKLQKETFERRDSFEKAIKINKIKSINNLLIQQNHKNQENLNINKFTKLP